MAISSIKSGYIGPQLTRIVDTTTSNTGVTTRAAMLSNEKRTREATLTVNPNAAEAAVVRTSSFTGPKVSREVSVTGNGEGSATRSVSTTLANGKVITRERSRTVNDDGSVSVSGTVNGLRGVRTYVADVDAAGVSGEITITRDNSTRTVSFDRAKNPEPRPLPPTVDLPVEPIAQTEPASTLPLDEIA